MKLWVANPCILPSLGSPEMLHSTKILGASTAPSDLSCLPDLSNSVSGLGVVGVGWESVQ